MTKRIEEFSVGALARLSGVNIRTLHHYDAIGLLSPQRAMNGYRLYRRGDALRLQEILFYRAAGMPLSDIAALLDDGDHLARLEAHRARLAGDLADRSRMLATLDRTIGELKGDTPMSVEDLYKPFDPETQADYEAWLVDTYGADMARSIASTKSHLAETPEAIEEKMAGLKPIEAALVAAYEGGQVPEAADCTAHRAWVAGMWGRDCPTEAYAGLADMYLSHPDFIARYESLSRGFSQWLPAAMKAWAADQTG